MASNPATPFGVEFGNVEQLHGARSGAANANAKSASHLLNDAGVGTRSAFSSDHRAATHSANAEREHPFAALAARHGRPLRIAILSDFTRIPYANGAAFQTRFLYQELRRCGHEVTVIGPHDPDATVDELPPGAIELPSLPLKTYPGVHIPMPLAPWVFDASRWNFDLIYAQTTSMLIEFGLWLRKMRGIPLICVNTTHLAAAYDVLLPERLSKVEAVHAGLNLALKRPYERIFANIYNQTDGLVVLSEGLKHYWRERGVTAPIHVIPRAVQPEVFDRPIGADPYVAFGERGLSGPRLLCAGRHTREKAQDRIIRIFARHVATREPEASLTMLGEGPDTELYKRVAEEEGVSHRVFFPGEVPFGHMADYYAHADLFVHGSLSETYGNVLGEALWCGTPTVAFADGMGVSAQITNGKNGVLLSPGGNEAGEREADRAFGDAVVALLSNPERRAELGTQASRISRERCSPAAVEAKIAKAFQGAQEHAAASGLRAMAAGPRPLQWLTTLKHFRSWSAMGGGVYLFGHLRRNAAPPAKHKSQLHPQIAT